MWSVSHEKGSDVAGHLVFLWGFNGFHLLDNFQSRSLTAFRSIHILYALKADLTVLDFVV